MYLASTTPKTMDWTYFESFQSSGLSNEDLLTLDALREIPEVDKRFVEKRDYAALLCRLHRKRPREVVGQPVFWVSDTAPDTRVNFLQFEIYQAVFRAATHALRGTALLIYKTVEAPPVAIDPAFLATPEIYDFAVAREQVTQALQLMTWVANHVLWEERANLELAMQTHLCKDSFEPIFEFGNARAQLIAAKEAIGALEQYVTHGERMMEFEIITGALWWASKCTQGELSELCRVAFYWVLAEVQERHAADLSMARWALTQIHDVCNVDKKLEVLSEAINNLSGELDVSDNSTRRAVEDLWRSFDPKSDSFIEIQLLDEDAFDARSAL